MAGPAGRQLGVVLGINHVGLAPKDPAKAGWFFREALGLASLGEELVTSQMTNTVMYASSVDASQASPQRLEVLIPTPAGAGAVGKFLEKKGAGIQHLALSVQGLEALLARLKGLGVRLIDEAPRAGAHRTRIAFVHPEATGGLLIELVEEEQTAHS